MPGLRQSGLQGWEQGVGGPVQSPMHLRWHGLDDVLQRHVVGQLLTDGPAAAGLVELQFAERKLALALAAVAPHQLWRPSPEAKLLGQLLALIVTQLAHLGRAGSQAHINRRSSLADGKVAAASRQSRCAGAALAAAARGEHHRRGTNCLR